MGKDNKCLLQLIYLRNRVIVKRKRKEKKKHILLNNILNIHI